jgi:hypothetical protein
MSVIKRVGQGRDEHFLDGESQTRYSRIVGGLAWPFGEKPGFLVVIGEDFVRAPGVGRSLYVLGEREGPYLDDLFRFYQEFREKYSADLWVGDPSIKGHIDFFYTAGGRDGQGFTLLEAPFYDDPHGLASYFQRIRPLLKDTQKILHLGERSILRGYLQALTREEMLRPACEHPPVAALGYAVAYLYFNRFDGRMTAEDVDNLVQWYGRRG